jgi:UDP-glucuronate 4-epimerase
VRYAVTGAAGFIGSHLAETLVAVGHEVVGLDSFSDYYDAALKEENARDLDVRRVDLGADPIDFSGFDAVFHLAGQPGARSFGHVFPDYLWRNLLATQRVFEAAVEADVPVVWASSSSVYGDAERYPTPEGLVPRPNNPYGVTKLSCEHLHDTYERVFGLRAVALRYFTVYGPRQRPDMAFRRFCEAVVAGRPIELFGDGRQTRDFTYVADIVAATRAAGEGRASGVLNVGGGGAVSVNRTLELLAGIAGRPLDVRRGARESGDVQDTGADISRARARLGYAPSTTVADGLAAEFDWVLSAPAERRARTRRSAPAAAGSAGWTG